jgi:hypothetical protein
MIDVFVLYFVYAYVFSVLVNWFVTLIQTNSCFETTNNCGWFPSLAHVFVVFVDPNM